MWKSGIYLSKRQRLELNFKLLEHYISHNPKVQVVAFAGVPLNMGKFAVLRRPIYTFWLSDETNHITVFIVIRRKYCEETSELY